MIQNYQLKTYELFLDSFLRMMMILRENLRQHSAYLYCGELQKSTMKTIATIEATGIEE